MFQENYQPKYNHTKSNSNILNHGTLFELSEISVNFGKLKALDRVQLKIQQGEIIFLTGASGAGKTTLLRLLCGEIEPNDGIIRRPIDFHKNVFLSNVFQDLRLISKWSLKDNLFAAYDPNAYRSKKEFISDMNEMAKVMGFYDRLDLKVMHANGGLKQKVAIARALLTKPDVFIADEPTSSLDVDNAGRVFDILNLYNSKKSMTVIWASHNKDLIRRFTGRTVHLDQGKMVYTGHACLI